jgi:hypothetical protein
MRKEYRNDFVAITFDTLDLPEGKVVALSFYSNKGEAPGFTICFPADTWKDFQREVSDYEPG